MAMCTCRIRHITYPKRLGMESASFDPVGTSWTDVDIRNIFATGIPFVVDHKGKAGASRALAPKVQWPEFQHRKPDHNVGNCH